MRELTRTSALVLLAVTVLAMVACAPVRTHKPYFQPIEEGEVRTLDLQGEIRLANGYSQREPVKLGAANAFGGGAYKGDLAVLTHMFTQQFHETMRRHVDNHEQGQNKLITAKVADASYRNRGAYHESRLEVVLDLSNGETIEFSKVSVSSRNPDLAVNGAIADAVIEALEHPRVREYLEG